MLFGQQFGRRHERHLCTAADGARGRGRGDHGLAATHIALDQPRHRLRARQILIDLQQYALLRRCQEKRQRLQQPRLESGAVRQGGRRIAPRATPQFHERQVVRQ